MNFKKIRHGKLALLLVILLISALAVWAGVGCSGKAKASDTSDEDNSAAANELETAEDNFGPVKETILELMQDQYSDWGIRIKSVELESGSANAARITLSYPDHTTDQAALAGLRILSDNFPRSKTFIAVIGGKKYTCPRTELSYICSNGYDYDADEESAEYYMSIVKGGIPEDDS